MRDWTLGEVVTKMTSFLSRWSQDASAILISLAVVDGGHDDGCVSVGLVARVFSGLHGLVGSCEAPDEYLSYHSIVCYSTAHSRHTEPPVNIIKPSGRKKKCVLVK
jgi:hypothetical protein